MSVIDINAASLSRDLQRPVPEIYVVVAKHEVLGLDGITIRETLGLTLQEWEELQRDEVYKSVLILLRAEHARTRVDTDVTYDALEELAVRRLYERVQHERDGDFLLKVAAVANRAQRRGNGSSNVLDPSAHALRVPLTLTRRVVNRLHSDGSQEREETQQITSGRVLNPSFREVDDILNVSAKPAMPKRMEIKTFTPEPDFNELDEEMSRRQRRGI